MGCLRNRPINTGNFAVARLANNLDISDLVGTIATCSLFGETPQNLIATVVSQTAIDLDWDAATGETPEGIAIYRSTNGTTYTLVDTVDGVDIAFSDTGLTEGTLYYYKIKATGAIDSAFSNVATAETALDFGLAISGDGTGDYVLIDSTMLGDALTFPMAFGFYVKWNGGDSVFNGDFVMDFRGTADAFYLIPKLRYTSPNGEARLSYKSSSGSANDWVTKPQDYIFDGAWHRFVYTVIESPLNSSYYWIRLYIDNELIQWSGNAYYIEDLKTDFPTTFGTNYNCLFSNSDTYNGNFQLDDVIMVAGAVAISDIESDWNSGNGSNHLGNNFTKIFHYRFNKAGATGGGNNTALSSVVDDSAGNYPAALSAGFTKNGSNSNWVTH